MTARRKAPHRLSTDNRARRAASVAAAPDRGTRPAASSPWKRWTWGAALVVAVFLVYQPAWHGDFLWDDELHLLNNPVLAPGGLLRAWVPGSYINYWPLTFTVYRLEFELWKLDPLGFHLVNIALHAICAILVWRVLTELDVRGAPAAAALFALHPVNVETVAWISQLKGILALLLGLAALLFYLRHDRRGGAWRYAAALAAFWLSTLAKGLVITLPLVLLACAWWRRGTIARRDLLRALPFLLVAALMTGVEIWAQQLMGAGRAVRGDDFLTRAAIAGCAVWFYLGKLLWPVDLCAVYPRWEIDGARLVSYLPGLALAVLPGLAWRGRRTWGRPVLVLLVCYVGLLAPALGFVNILFMQYSLVADHWQYAAMIAPCAALAGVVATWASRRPDRRILAGSLCFLALAILAVLTWQQAALYGDPKTLYETTLRSNPACATAHNNLGLLLANRGQLDDAALQYRAAMRIDPDRPAAHYNLAHVLGRLGREDEAIAEFREALRLDPDFAGGHNDLGFALAARGELAEAIDHYRRALELKPGLAIVHNNLALALADRGELDAAVAHYRKALEINPELAVVCYNLAATLARRGDLDEAIAQYRRVLEINPDFAVVHYVLGDALEARGRPSEAIEHYREALAAASARNDSAQADEIRARIRRLQTSRPAAAPR